MEFPALEACVRQYQDRFDRLYDEDQKPFQPSKISDVRLAEIQEVIGEVLPQDFVRIVTSYDFSGLDSGQMVFCYGDEYDNFEMINSPEGMPWWISGERPKSLIAVAGTSGWSILLNVSNGLIYAFENPWKGEIEPIAPSFDVLLRASCAAAVDNPIAAGLEDEFLAAVGNPRSRFWTQALRGWA